MFLYIYAHKRILAGSVKDLQAFNVDILGKRAWRLWPDKVHEPGYLDNGGSLWVFYIGKKYFLHGNFMEVKVFAKHSKTWKMLLC